MPSGKLQNKHNYQFAESTIEKMSYEEKINKIEEFKKVGYGYNANMFVLIEGDTFIPYDFIFFCLLMDDIKKKKNNDK